jgi:hypothetical protein
VIPTRRRKEEEIMDRIRILWQGLVAGLIGYAVVAIVFSLTDAFAGRSAVYTAALLGGAYFYGARTLAEVVVAPGPVLAYNGAHLVVFLALGLFVALLTELAERGPQLWYVGMLSYFLVAFHLYALAFSLPDLLRDVMLGWGTLACGIAASLAMGLYMVWSHPRLREELRDFSALDRDRVDKLS